MTRRYLAIVILSALALATNAYADNEGWQSLFDGKTLTGWIQKNGQATYHVEDGTLVGTTAKDSANSFLCTEQEYADFELEFEVHLRNNELNSGVQIRSQTRPAAGAQTFGRVNGPQVEIEASGSNGANSGYIYCEACGGWMTPADKLKPRKVFKDGEWNSYRIVSQGARMQTWIKVHGVGKRGPFQVAWRNIRIKELSKK